jgi:hypothetical protein
MTLPKDNNDKDNMRMNRMTQDELTKSAELIDNCMVEMLKLGKSKIAGELQEMLVKLVLKHEWNERMDA